jgi:hypothetical protein
MTIPDGPVEGEFHWSCLIHKALKFYTWLKANTLKKKKKKGFLSRLQVPATVIAQGLPQILKTVILRFLFVGGVGTQRKTAHYGGISHLSENKQKPHWEARGKAELWAHAVGSPYQLLQSRQSHPSNGHTCLLLTNLTMTGSSLLWSQTTEIA